MTRCLAALQKYIEAIAVFSTADVFCYGIVS